MTRREETLRAAEEAFLQVVQLDAAKRREYLEALAPPLRAEVESLLEYDISTRSFLAGDEASGVVPGGTAPVRASTGEWTGFEGEARLPVQIGSYRIVRILGRGGMGVVYEARQESPQRVVALKVVRPEFGSAATLRRFQYEVEVLGRLHHPGIGQIYEAGMARTEHGSQPFFAMELIDGPTVQDFVGSRKLSEAAILRLFIPICDAVHYAHQKGVIHRDLKPGNILVAENEQPKILDFGIARSTHHSDHAPTEATGAGHLLGTLSYMSPEQARFDVGQVDVRSDVYSLGVILFELLTGHLPLATEGKPVHEALRVVVEEEPARLGALHRAFRGDLETLLAKALEKDPARRYQSASDLARDLERFLHHEPILARPASAFYQVQKFARRHRALVAGATLALLFLVVGLVASLTLLAQKNRAQEDAARAQDRAAEEERQAATSFAMLRVQALQDMVETLWPARPTVVPRMEDWLAQARAAVAELPLHQALLTELRQEPPDPASARDLPGIRQHFLSELAGMVAVLERWQEPGDGEIARIEQRKRWAASVLADSVHAHAAEWEAACAAVQSSPYYDGLELSPQLGLVPLGESPGSGLHEFWAPETGERPRRAPDGHHAIEEETGVVMVLLPGGLAWLGASRDPTASNSDPGARPEEGPVNEVELAPFFLSRYEMTQAQWQRLTSRNPSYYGPGTASALTRPDGRHPVEQVSYYDSIAALGRIEWTLPTEAQWEYACRAATETAWSGGAEPRDLQGHANLADEGTRRSHPAAWSFERDFDDGFDIHAPVGSLAPNDFGFHDMHGNVWEWCLDVGLGYRFPVRPGTGERIPEAPEGPAARAEEIQQTTGVCRGGSFGEVAERCRSAARNFPQRDNTSRELGVRPARPIMGPWSRD